MQAPRDRHGFVNWPPPTWSTWRGAPTNRSWLCDSTEAALVLRPANRRSASAPPCRTAPAFYPVPVRVRSRTSDLRRPPHPRLSANALAVLPPGPAVALHLASTPKKAWHTNKRAAQRAALSQIV